MVQVLPYVPGFGEQLAGVLGEAGADIGKGLIQRSVNEQERKKQLEINKEKGHKQLHSLFKQRKSYDAFSPDFQRRAEDRAQEYIARGYSPFDAANAAHMDMERGFVEPGSSAQQQGSPLSQIQGSPQSQQYISPLQKVMNSPISRLKQMAKEKVQEKNASLVESNKAQLEAEKSKKAPTKPIEELSYQEILELPTEYVNSLPMEERRKIGAKLHEGAELGVNFAFTKGLDPTGVVSRAEKELAKKGNSPIPQPNEGTQAPLAASELVGSLIKDLGLFGLAGKAATVPGKAAAAAGIFGGEKALKTAVEEGRAPTAGEVGGSAAFGAAGELVGPAFKYLFNKIKSIPSAFKSVEEAASLSKGAVTEEKIVQEAVKNLESRGVSVVKAAEGDASAINEVQKESKKVADTFKQAEKYNRKQLEKIRGEKADKIVQSPLEVHFKPEKEVEHRAETLAKEAIRVKPLELSIKQNERRLLNLQYEILSGEKRLMEAGGTLTVAEKERARSLIDIARLNHAKALNEIKAAQFEIKHGKPPMTTEQIQEQITKSFDEIRAGIKDPTAAKIQKMEKALGQNKEGLERAERLLARGELPGPKVFDEFIKIKQEYIKAYGDLIDEMKGFIRENKSLKEKASEVANADKIMKLVEKSRDHAKASVVNQIDKRKAMKMLEGPSGALWKNLLKDVRKDVEAFQREWVSVRKMISPQEAKSAQAAKRALETPKGEARPLAKAQAEKSAQAANESLKETVEEIGQALNKGKATESDASKLEQALRKWGIKLSKIPGDFSKGFALGALQGILEESLGVDIPVGFLGGILPGGTFSRGVGTSGSAWSHKLVKQLFNHIETERLRKLRNTPEFHPYKEKLLRKYSKQRVSQIIKDLDQPK